MKQNILRSYISILLIAIVSLSSIAQETETDSLSTRDFVIADADTNDTIVKPKNKKHYRIRFGVDISKPILGAFDEDFSGFEFVTDFRLSKKFFIAAEFGRTEKFDEETFMNYSTKGTFTKIGVNYNLYDSWASVNNEIYFGLRYGFSSFTQTLHNYTPNVFGTYFTAPFISAEQEFTDLNAHWAELVMGLKVEAIKNIFVGFSFSLEAMLSQTQPENFLNMYVPGFTRVFTNETGFSFNYTIAYSIPLYKKQK